MKIFDWVFGSWNSAFEAGTLSRTVGERNSHILGKKLVMIDELDKAAELSTDAQMEKWKSMITEDKLATTPLYSSTIKVDNFTNHIVATNNLKVLRIPSMKDIGDGDNDIKSIIRRFCVFKLSLKYRQNIEFFKNFESYWKTQSFADHFYTYFMKRCELESSSPLEAVISEEIRKIVGSQKPAHIEFWDELREDTNTFNHLVSKNDIVYAPRINKYKISAPDAYMLYTEFCQKAGYKKPLTRPTFCDMSSDLSFIADYKKTNGNMTFYFEYTQPVEENNDD